MSSRVNRPSPEQFRLFHLQSQHAGETLGSVLKQFLADSSWGQIQTWIRSRHVQINGNLCCDAARRLTEKDVIKFWLEPLAKPVTSEQLKLPYIDEHLLVVEKPAGITSVWHREERRLPDKRRQLQPTLEELLPDAIGLAIGYPKVARPTGRAGAPLRGGQKKGKPALGRWPVFPVHRLDRDTSGLMVFARSRIAEQKLVRLFRDHKIDRQYWAVAFGQVKSQTVRSLLVRDRGDGLRGSLTDQPATNQPAANQATADQPITSQFSVPLSSAQNAAANKAPRDSSDGLDGGDGDEQRGQIAVTHVEQLESLGPYSIVRCRLETGRTHQIRIHLAEQGHPLCGEKTYVRLPDGQLWQDDSSAPRQVLHSDRLSFTHPLTGEKLQFHMPLPIDLKKWLQKLRERLK